MNQWMPRRYLPDGLLRALAAWQDTTTEDIRARIDPSIQDDGVVVIVIRPPRDGRSRYPSWLNRNGG